MPSRSCEARTHTCTCTCHAHTRARARAHTHTYDWPCGADWLVERRVLSKGSYQKALRTVHAKIAAALAEERPDCPGIAEVLPPGVEQEKVSYASCCSVLELLREGGLLAEKSFLGSYTNPHAARWADIVKRYEAGSIFLVDMAQGLVHNCTYELPAIKKDMGRAQKELHELERKQAEYNRLADGGRQRFQEMCALPPAPVPPASTHAYARAHTHLIATPFRAPATPSTRPRARDPYPRRCDRRHMAPCGHDEIATQLRLTIVQLKPVYERVGRLCQAAAAVEACAFYRRFVLFCLDQARAAEPPPTEEAARPKGGKGKKEAPAEKAAPVALMGEAEAAASCMAQLQRVQALTLGDDAPTLAGAGAAGAASGGAVAEVDWGDADEGGAAPPAEVDWGAEIDGGAAVSAVEVDWGGDGGEVDWGGDSDAATGWGGLIEVEEGDDGECGGLSRLGYPGGCGRAQQADD